MIFKEGSAQQIYPVLSATRELISRFYQPTVGEISRGAEDASSLQKGLMENSRQDIQLALDFVASENFAINRASLAARFVLNLVGEPHLISAALTRKQDVARFIYWFDMADGTLRIVSRILAAEKIELHLGDATMTHALNSLGRDDIPASEITNHYLYELRKAEEAHKMLKDDPTGFSLIHSCIMKIKDSNTEDRDPCKPSSYQVREYFLAGGKLAFAVYRKVFPLTKKYFVDKKKS